MPGWGRRAAQDVIAETGTDMTRFPTPGHLASWCERTPLDKQSGARTGQRGHKRGNKYVPAGIASGVPGAEPGPVPVLIAVAVAIDAQLILDASRRSVQLWPEDEVSGIDPRPES